MKQFVGIFASVLCFLVIASGCSDDPEQSEVRLPNTCDEHCATAACPAGSICNIAADETRGFCRPIAEVTSCTVSPDVDMGSTDGGDDMQIGADMVAVVEEMGEEFVEGELHGTWILSFATSGELIATFYLQHDASTDEILGTFELQSGKTGELGVTVWVEEVFSTSWTYEYESDDTEETDQFTQALRQGADIYQGKHRSSLDDTVRDALMTRE
jgi:hypothetical protein